MLSPAQAAAPIGVFDSGVGGLSVLQALKVKLPDESCIYVADSAYAPYGDRSPEFIEARACAVAAFLVARGAKALVLACNTASAVAAAALRARYTLPIVAMEPAIKPAMRITKSKVVLVLATSTTIRSHSVAQLCCTHGADARIILQACPGLADQVERGQFRHPVTRGLLEKYLVPGLAAGADTIVLGCTHYAFLASEIAEIAGPSVTVLEPSDAIARQLTRRLAALAPVAQCRVNTTAFYTSGTLQAMSSFLAVIGEPAVTVQALGT
jgi:glutamate racemase